MYYESHRDLSPFYSYFDNHCYPHFHQSVELLYCTEKPKSVTVDGVDYTVGVNELLVVFPYEIHAFKKSNASDLCVAFPPSLCGAFLSAIDGKTPSTHLFKNVEFTSDIYKHLLMIKNNVSSVTLNGITNYVLGRILDNVTLEKKKVANSNIILDVLNYINANYSENITLEKLAKEFGYSKYYFSALFNEKLKTGISQYLNSVRIQKSLNMLKTSSVTSVAYAVGFNSTQQFYLNFKKIMGVTPKQYFKK